MVMYPFKAHKTRLWIYLLISICFAFIEAV